MVLTIPAVIVPIVATVAIWIVAVPDRDGGWLVGEAWLRAEEGDTIWENGWWWAGTSPGEYHDSPIIEINYGPPKWWKPLPLPLAPGAEDE